MLLGSLHQNEQLHAAHAVLCKLPPPNHREVAESDTFLGNHREPNTG